MEKVSTRVCLAPITNDDVARAISGGLQHLFNVERHAVSRVSRILDIGLRRAKAILYGEAAPTTAQTFQLMRSLGPEFSDMLVKKLAGHDLTDRDRAKAIATAEKLEHAAGILRREALSHEENFHDECGYR